MSKKPKIRSFAKRLTRWIALTQLIVMGLASYYIYLFSKSFIMIEEASLYKSALTTANANVARVLSEVSVGTGNRVDEIEKTLDQPDKLANIMSEVVTQNPAIRSCGISFVDGYYPQKGHWFCPYAVRDDDGTVKQHIIGNASHDYLKAEWFTEALEADSSYWSKPFFDSTDSITPLVSYMIPIHDKQGKTVAILGADLSLNWIGERMQNRLMMEGDSVNISLGNDEDADKNDGSLFSLEWRNLTTKFIIDHDGTFLVHDDKDYIIKKNYFERAKETSDSTDDHVGHQMVAGRSGAYFNETGLLVKPFRYFDSDFWSVYMFYEPVENTNWSIASVVRRINIDSIAIAMALAMLVMIAIALLVTRIVGKIIVRRIAKPLRKLAESANEVAKGNFSAPLPKIKHNDEIRLLRDSFEGMQHSLTTYIDELKETTASKAAIENELKVAHDIQMSMLPKTFPPYPDRDDVDIFGKLTPAKDVGGDLFDFYIRDEKLFFCIGDVSGKGVPASLVMAMTRSLFRNISLHVSEPNVIVKALNAAVADGNETNMFVTLFLGVLDLHTGVLQYCNAGHNSPLLIGGNVRTLDCDSNIPIGVMNDWAFTRQEIQMESQSIIFLYTDGLNEAEDTMHAQFGEDRILRVLETQVAQGTIQPETIVTQMNEAVHRFVDNAEQSDDLTMLVIKYTKNNG
ncbi:MAG: SpoIIE family protein phosphatase [Prevotella sp.]|nr:SpoIIE family protein phosphatase [Prevotella sp.]